ncbi:hypothetical protein PVK06_008302 [Gossypium arboreum]|uniref:Uncharacterized protein n=1 Tax=Gossypium arboreum TaxID=29729 RepID=A0ABR0QJL2_GOSAR|nr:hypothetical protein PVK06_008302 [Gossypium arboreum]
MDSEGNQGRKGLPISPDHEIVQEKEVRVSSPTSGGDNPEHGTEALTQLVREVLEEVFEAIVKEIGEMLQARCLDYKKKRDHNSLRLEPRSVKSVKMHLNFSACEHCKRYHSGECRRKSGACLRCGSNGIRFGIAKSLLSRSAQRERSGVV